MAILIKPGSSHTASKVRRGSGEHGNWELIVVKDSGKSRKTVSVWATNAPTSVCEDGQFTLETIDEVKYGSKQNNGQWFDEVSVRGKVVPAESYGSTPAAPGAFKDMGSDDSDLPF